MAASDRTARIITTAAAAVLAAAGIAKLVAAWSAPGFSLGHLELPRWLAGPAIAAELILVLLLLSGAWQRPVRATSAVVFALFALFAGWLAWSGATSCGCFGRIAVHPAATAALDAVLALALGWTVRGSRHGGPGRGRLAAILGGSTIVAIGLPLLLMLHHPGIADALPRLRDAAGDAQMPVQRLQQGEWIVILYRRSCPECRSHLAEWWDLAAGDAAEGGRSWAFIEILDEPGVDDPLGRLSAERVVRWRADLPQARTPEAWLLRDGMVVRRGRSPLEVL